MIMINGYEWNYWISPIHPPLHAMSKHCGQQPGLRTPARNETNGHVVSQNESMAGRCWEQAVGSNGLSLKS